MWQGVLGGAGFEFKLKTTEEDLKGGVRPEGITFTGCNLNILCSYCLPRYGYIYIYIYIDRYRYRYRYIDIDIYIYI